MSSNDSQLTSKLLMAGFIAGPFFIALYFFAELGLKYSFLGFFKITICDLEPLRCWQYVFGTRNKVSPICAICVIGG